MFLFEGKKETSEKLVCQFCCIEPADSHCPLPAPPACVPPVFLMHSDASAAGMVTRCCTRSLISFECLPYTSPYRDGEL